MKKIILFLTLCVAFISIFTACQQEYESREIINYEVIEGKLWITYEDDPNTPVCVGKISENDVATEGLEFCLQDDGTYWVAVGSAKNISNIVVPQTYRGKNVTGIMANAFSNCKNLETIFLPDTIKVVDNYAFSSCSGLIRIELPEGVHTVGDSAFSYCSKLVSASVPASIVDISTTVFTGCRNLIEICNKSSFDIQIYDSESWTYTNIRHIITDIKDSFLFYENDFIYYRDGFEVILCGYVGDNSEIVLPNNEKYSIHSNAFYSLGTITKITIPSNVVSIGESAFQYCENLKEIKIDVGVTLIDRYAFWGCYNSTIMYSGTINQWEQIEKKYNAVNHNTDMPISVIYLSGAKK